MASRARTPVLRQLLTAELTPGEIGSIRALMTVAFGDEEDERFTEDDWQHALGGVHFLLDLEGAMVAHASVVPRYLHVGARRIRTGYVEAVATEPGRQGTGLGTRLMAAVNERIRDEYELGALGTGRHSFYERLGWQRWRGPSFVRTEAGDIPTPDDDGYILVLSTPTSPALHLGGPIVCEWRPGDVW